ncbi:MAG: sodium:solute symporter [Ignavibacteriales bacterium CG_4_9_14_3_um_filter_30_11]|nr:MAG: sodium:solute symporter [Ignavibacteriales bacterium CG_4_9_14_3_um_filter_30_11]
MRSLDWIILCGTLMFIVVYGVWKGRGSKNMKSYVLSNNDMKWYTITISIMATQASAITFLSTPGQAYVDGMRFVQFYLGLPIAMIILSVTAVPLYHKLKVYTAYEFLENRLDLKTRILAATLFLMQRGLAAGLTIYAPSIILSMLLGWNIYWTNLIIGVLVIIYTTSGGAKAVGWTQFQQMIIISLGMFGAFYMILYLMPDNVSVLDSIKVAGKMGKLNAIDFSFDLNNRYSFWSGLLGGLFLQLSYFGTDQSQVQRYLTGESVKQSRLGLLINGIVKIPMQFSILFIGAMLFVFYQFSSPPLFFNPVEETKIIQSIHGPDYSALQDKFKLVQAEKKDDVFNLIDAMHKDDKVKVENIQSKLDVSESKIASLRNGAKSLIKKNDSKSDTNDTNYIFLNFVLNFLPVGLIGLVLAAIFSASMSSTSSEINSLASTTVIDLYKRLFKKDASEKHYVFISKSATVFWGIIAILFAQFANKMGSLIEAVNILGSLFYGTILGIFLIAFYLRKASGTATFYSAIISEIIVVFCFIFTGISFLWYNVIGCMLVILLALIIDYFFLKKQLT